MTEDFLKELRALWADLDNPVAREENPYYGSKYTPLPELISYVKPILLQHGFMLIQTTKPTENSRSILIETKLCHAKGEISNTVEVPLEGATPQKMGSAITYGRRYSIATILGIASDYDDDANVFEDTKKTKTNAATSTTNSTTKASNDEIEHGADPHVIKAAQLFAEIVKIVNHKKLDSNEKKRIMDLAKKHQSNPKYLQNILDDLSNDK